MTFTQVRVLTMKEVTLWRAIVVGTVGGFARAKQRQGSSTEKKKSQKRRQSLYPTKSFGFLSYNESETRGQHNMDLSPIDNNILDEFNARLLVRGR